MTKPKAKFPPVLFVRAVIDGDDKFFIATDTIEEAMDGDELQTLATYELDECVKASKQVVLEE